MTTVWIVYGEDFVYGHDTGVIAVFADEVKAAVFAARATINSKTHNYTWKKMEVIQ